MHRTAYIFLVLILTGVVISCNRDVTTFNDVHFSLVFDPTQERLDNLGAPSEVPAGNAAQTPDMRLMSVHYIEMTPDAFTAFKDGSILYTAPETSAGGANAIDFAQSDFSDGSAEFAKVDLNRLAPGTYNYIRASVAYQELGVQFDLHNIPLIGDLNDQSGILASFLGFNTYLTTIQVGGLEVTVNGNKEQGYWAFATQFSEPYTAYNAVYTGQSPAGSTTVVNPIDATSPVPEGSCVITGVFSDPLVVAEDEDRELYISLSFSTNNSFEWIDTDGDGKWDIDALDPGASEQVVDMGIRGLIPTWEWRDE